MDEAGQRNFSRALAVAKQVFNSLTEYIQVSVMQNSGGEQAFFKFMFVKSFLCGCFQGPCVGNQQSLAHSRLWDAVVGFLHVFANMQMKLSQVCIRLFLCQMVEHRQLWKYIRTVFHFASNLGFIT